MFFKKKRTEDVGDGGPGNGPAPSDVPDTDRTDHGRYTVMALPKQLHNGRWIVNIALHDQEMDRRFDFAGPMTEFETREEAVGVGLRHAAERIDSMEATSAGGAG